MLEFFLTFKNVWYFVLLANRTEPDYRALIRALWSISTRLSMSAFEINWQTLFKHSFAQIFKIPNTSLYLLLYVIHLTDINDCENDPCENGGTCVDKVNGFTCNCVKGFEGNKCQTSKWHHMHALFIFNTYLLDYFMESFKYHTESMNYVDVLQ